MTTGGLFGANMFAYCINNPVMSIDSSGNAVETVIDVMSLSVSICDVVMNPYDISAWVCLAGDAIDLIPFVTGVGETARFLRTLNTADNLVDLAKTSAKYDGIGRGFSSYGEMKKALGSAGPDMEWHHIVEQSQISRSGFDPTMIHNTNNIIPIDSTTHKKISAYYSSKQSFTEGKTVRDWLAGQSFEYQYEFGLDVIERYSR